MPFKKTGKDSYTSPSGRKMSKKQVQAYHASKKGRKGKKKRKSY